MIDPCLSAFIAFLKVAGVLPALILGSVLLHEIIKIKKERRDKEKKK